MSSADGFYVIFNMGIEGSSPLSPDWSSLVLQNLKQIGIDVRAIYLADADQVTEEYLPKSGTGRYAFCFSGGTKDDVKAQRVVDAFLATITLLYQSDFTRLRPFETGPSAIWLPAQLLRYGSFLTTKDLYDYNAVLENQVGFSATIPQEMVEKAWRLLPVVHQDPYFDAVHFYQASLREFCFVGDVIGDVLMGDLTKPLSRSEFARAEDAILNAFKAVEAIVGDPPKDERRFHQRLRGLGIDPDMPVGFVGRGLDSDFSKQEPIAAKIRGMSDARDKKAAHGSTRSDRRITYLEIMDYQALAQSLLRDVIERHPIKAY